MSELKLCPICNEQAQAPYVQLNEWITCCTNEDCPLHGVELTIDAWNAIPRRDDPQLPAEVCVEFDETVTVGGRHHIKQVWLNRKDTPAGVAAYAAASAADDPDPRWLFSWRRDE